LTTAPPERFEEVLERLQAIVKELEGGTLTLEQSLRQFEEGVALSRLGARMLDEAERKVEVLLQGADGSPRTEPFPEGGNDEGPS
jgi:exodeoxyribonuclease VII small subunit